MARWMKPRSANCRSHSTTSESSRASRSPVRAAPPSSASMPSRCALAGSEWGSAAALRRSAASAAWSSSLPLVSRNPPRIRKPWRTSVPNTASVDSCHPSTCTWPASTACFGCGAAGNAGNSATTCTPALASAAATSPSVTDMPSAFRSRVTVPGPTCVAAPASVAASRASRSRCSRWRVASRSGVSCPVRSSSACAAISVSASRA
jgi:hypothetical protein